jgi:hypothetical protein
MRFVTVATACLRTRYVVALGCGVRLELRLGIHDGRVDAMLQRFGAHSYTFLTSDNPGSLTQSPDVNRQRRATLAADLQAHGLRSLPGFAWPDHGRWATEQCRCVFDLDQELTQRFCTTYRQDVVVVGACGVAPRLLFSREIFMAPKEVRE